MTSLILIYVGLHVLSSAVNAFLTVVSPEKLDAVLAKNRWGAKFVRASAAFGFTPSALVKALQAQLNRKVETLPPPSASTDQASRS